MTIDYSVPHEWGRSPAIGVQHCVRCNKKFDVTMMAGATAAIEPCWTMPVNPARRLIDQYPGIPEEFDMRECLIEAVDDLYKTLEAVLLFHSASPWDDSKRLRWLELTGTTDATTKTLCETVRKALS